MAGGFDGREVTTGPWVSSSERVKDRTHLSSSLILGDSFPRVGLEKAVPKALRCSRPGPCGPAGCSLLSSLQDFPLHRGSWQARLRPAAKPAGDRNWNAGWGIVQRGTKQIPAPGRPLPQSVKPGLPELLNSTPSALSDPLFKFSACLALLKIISIHLFFVLALRHYSLQELSARLTDAPISTQS